MKSTIYLLILFFVFIGFNLNSYSQSLVISERNIQFNTTWGPNQTIVINEDLTVDQGVTLTIAAGCKIQFGAPFVDLIVNGILLVQGSENSPVLFQPTEENNEWGGILLQNTEVNQQSVIQHAVFEKGGSNYFSSSSSGMVRIINCSPQIDHCVFQNSGAYVILLENSEAVIRDCHFINNAAEPVWMNLDSSPILSNNTATGNRYDGVRISSGSLQKNRTWRVHSLPYLIDEDITVPENIELIIEAGVMIQFVESFSNLNIYGNLTAVGTSDQPITFTSANDSDERVWGGILFAQSSSTNSILNHCVIKYGGSNYFSSTQNSMARCHESSPTISNCQFVSSQTNGLSLLSSNAQLVDVHFESNIQSAAYMDPNSYPVFTSISAGNNQYDAIVITSGSLGQSGRWDYVEIPYLLNGDVDVPAGMTLTIDPNTEIQFLAQSTDLNVYGSLIAEGMDSQPITFISVNRIEQSGSWGGILFQGPNSSDSILKHCVVSYGGSNYFSNTGTANVRIDNASPAITDCVIQNSRTDGLALFQSTSIIERNRIENCQSYAIRMDVHSFPFFAQNQASGNSFNNITIRGGELSTSGRWGIANLDYNLEDDVTIPESVHLSIDAGNTIRFQQYSTDLIVKGSLEAIGSVSSPIVFTSLYNHEAGSFGGVYFAETIDNTNTHLSYCVIENGGSNYFSHTGAAVVFFDQCSPTFTFCTFQNNKQNGLWIKNAAPTVENCRFQNNRNNAIVIESNSFPLLKNISAEGNGSNAILIKGGNWSGTGVWPSPSIPYEITDDVILTEESDITLASGNTIQFSRFLSDLIVHGKFNCLGTESRPILLTSGNAIPTPGSWGSLVYENNASGAITYTEIEYGGSNYFSNGSGAQLAFLDSDTFSITNLNIRESGGQGISVRSSNIQLSQTVFQNNQSSAIDTSSDSNLIISNSQFDSNQIAVQARDSAQVSLNGSSFSNNVNALSTSGSAARIQFGNNQFTNNALLGRVNFLTAASSDPGNIVTNSGPLEIIEGELDLAGIMNPLIGGYYQTARLLTISEEGSLQIRPGTMMAFNAPAAGLQVAGYLSAMGEDDRPIVFSAPPTIEYATTRSIYNGFSFIDQSQGILRNAVFQNGGRSGAALDVQGAANVSAERCLFQANGTAVRIREFSQLHAAYNRLNDNTIAVWADDTSQINSAIQFSRIEGNDSGVRNDSQTAVVDATLNWWGDASGPSGEGPGSGDSVTSNVLYDPWFTSAEQVPDQPLEPQELSIGETFSNTISHYGLHLYHITAEENRNLLCQLTSPNQSSRYQLFAAYGYEPSAARYDSMVDGPQLRSAHELLIPNTESGEYYVLVFAKEIVAEEDVYEIQFTYVDQYVTALSPMKAGNKGSVTLTLSGSDFNDSVIVQFVSPNGKTIDSQRNQMRADDSTLYAEFDLTNAQTGRYQFTVQWPDDNVQYDFPAAFEIQPGIGAKLVTDFTLPNLVRPNRTYTALLHFHNEGDADLTAPIFVVSSDPVVPMALSNSDPFLKQSIHILGIAANSPASVLPPGAGNTIPILFQVTTNNPIEFSIGVLSNTGELVAWNHPDFVVYSDAVGQTWGAYQLAIAEQANILWENGILEYDGRQLIQSLLNVLFDQPSAVIRGQVIDRVYQHPQTQRVIVLTNQSETVDNSLIYEEHTDVEGYFEITGVSAGNYLVEVEGYTDISPVELAVTQGSTISDLVIHVPYGGEIQGTVFDDPDRYPIQSVIVSVKNQEGTITTAITDEEGSYCFYGLSEGLYEILAELQGYTSKRYEGLQIQDGQVLREIDFILRPELTLQGKVLDAQTNMGIEDAGVIAFGENGIRYPARSLQDGSYTIERLEAGNYTIQCFAPSYILQNQIQVTLTDLAIGQFDILMQPALHRSGRVIEEDTATGIADSLVMIYNLRSGLSDFFVSGENGLFDLSTLDPGLYYMNAQAEGYAKGQVLVDIQSVEAPGLIEIPLRRSASIRGTILDPQGQGISSDATLIINGENDQTLATIESMQGEFSLSGLPIGSVSIQTIYDKFIYPVQTVELESDVSDLVISPYQSELSGMIQNETAAPIANATVTLIPIDSWNPNLDALVTTSDESGMYQYQGVTPGPFLLTVNAPGFAREIMEGTIGDTNQNLNFTLSESITRTGKISLQGSEASIPYAMILIKSHPADPGIVVFTDENGEFIDERLGQGIYTFIVYAEGYPVHVETISLTDQNDPLTMEISDQGIMLQCTVIDAQKSYPLPHTKINITFNGFSVYSGETDFQGRFQTSSLMPGDYQITLSFMGNILEQDITIAPEPSFQIQEFTLALSPGIGLFLEEQAIAALKDMRNIMNQIQTQLVDPSFSNGMRPSGLTGAIFSSEHEYNEYETELPNFPRSPLAEEILDYVGGNRYQWLQLASDAFDPFTDNSRCQNAANNVYYEFRNAEHAYMRVWNQWVLNRSLATYAGTAESIAQFLVLAGHIADLGLLFTGKGAGFLKELHDNVGHAGTAQSAYNLAKEAYKRISISFNQLLEGKINFTTFSYEVNKHLRELKQSEDGIKIQAALDPNFAKKEAWNRT